MSDMLGIRLTRRKVLRAMGVGTGLNRVKLLLVIMLFFLIPFSVWTQDCPFVFETLDSRMITTAELNQGRWVLGFIIIPGCPACEEVIEWFGQAAKEFPEVHFLLVAPEDTPELRVTAQTHAPEIHVLLDREHILRTSFEVEQYPTVTIHVEGVWITKLDWPFSKGELLQEITESLFIEIEFPDPRDLLGQPAPEFSSVDLEEKEISLADLTLPLLLLFFNPECPLCWETLPALIGLLKHVKGVAVGLVILVREPRFSETYKRRLEQFLQGMEEGERQQVTVILDKWVEEGGFKIVQAYKVRITPTYILINEKGVIIWVLEGIVRDQDLWDTVRTALERNTGQ